MTSDENFAKEFTEMMNGLRANTGYLNIGDVPIPPNLAEVFAVQDKEQCLVRGITEPYFDKLNEHSHTLLGHIQTKRRKFDYQGNFVYDKKTGEIATVDIDVPRECIAIVSDIMIGLPYSKKENPNYIYVDYTENLNSKGETVRKYIYIVPRQYCFKLNQTALVISWNKINRNFFKEVALSLSTGNILYLAVIPYKPTTSERPYKVLTTKVSMNYDAEIDALISYWIQNQVMFNPSDCELTEDYKGRNNLAYQYFDSTLEMWQSFDENKSMAYEGDASEDLNFDITEV